MRWWVYQSDRLIGWVIADTEEQALKYAYEKYAGDIWVLYSVKQDKQ